jgi:glycosyltransferase involved in cell wall biosynthesis
VSPSRISVIVNGIDPGRMEGGGEGNVRAELGIAPNESVVAVIGRLVRDKGHEHALRAFAAVARKRPDARLLVVGSGKLEPELSDLADAVAPPGSVIFAGHREDIAAVLRASDLLLVSSLREGMPHVVLEAMVAGTPVVATSVAGIPEMIENGRHGLLVRPGSDQDLARAALRLLSDRSLGRRLAAEAGERVRSEFSLATMLDRVEECFAEEIEARRRDLET